MIKISIIGCGRVFEHYKKIFKSKELKPFKVSQICDKNKINAKKIGVLYNCKYYTDYKKMINESTSDLIIILSPSGLHYEHSYYALNKNLNVLVEKPITLKIHHAEKLIRLAKRKKLIFGIAFQNRLNPSIIKLREAILDKRFGKIISCSVRLRWCRFQQYYDDEWHGKWSMDGGVLNQQAIHHIDALNYLLGPINTVYSISDKRLNKLEAEDTIVAVLKLKNGALATFEATTAARPKDLEASLTITGELGEVVIGGIALNKIHSWSFINKKKSDILVKKQFSNNVPNGYGLSHKEILKDIFNNIRNKKNNIKVKASETLSTLQLVHSIYASCEKKKPINLKDNVISKKLGN